MRSDKEQLELILQKKGVAEARRKRNRRLIYSAFSLFLCLAVVLSYMAVTTSQKNRKEGFETGDRAPSLNTPTNPDENYWGFEDGVVGEDDADNRLDYNGDDTEMARPEATDKIGVDEVPDTYPYIGDTQKELQSGTLTAGEIKDNANYKAWLEALQKWGSLGSKWKLSTAKRITVQTTGVAGAVVELLDANGKVLYGAVSNAKGVAYLFVDEQTKIKTVAVRAEGKSATAEYEGTDYIFDMSFTKEPSKTLDLMFMVDTTGSMGDELEYLKVEIADVINRISSNDIDVRTSVNFYRDAGDEYIVRYHDFRTDAEEVQEIVKQQSANGGGDYEEAVHTALSTALEQKWQADSVKVMFLILDAPPHSDSAVIDSINDSVKKAAAMGIRIVPVASSGIDEFTEWFLRSIALITGGTYTFLTDTSGVGNPHKAPTAEQYKEERLNDMLVRIAMEYCGIDTKNEQAEVSSENEDSNSEGDSTSTDGGNAPLDNVLVPEVTSYVSLSDKAPTVYIIKGEKDSYTIKAVVPANVTSSTIVLSTSKNLTIKEGTLKTVEGNSVVNESYNRDGIKGACVTFAYIQDLPENTVVYEAEYTAVGGAAISEADVSVKKWNLVADMDYLGTQDTEQVVIKYAG